MHCLTCFLAGSARVSEPSPTCGSWASLGWNASLLLTGVQPGWQCNQCADQCCPLPRDKRLAKETHRCGGSEAFSFVVCIWLWVLEKSKILSCIDAFVREKDHRENPFYCHLFLCKFWLVLFHSTQVWWTYAHAQVERNKQQLNKMPQLQFHILSQPLMDMLMLLILSVVFWDFDDRLTCCSGVLKSSKDLLVY